MRNLSTGLLGRRDTCGNRALNSLQDIAGLNVCIVVALSRRVRSAADYGVISKRFFT